MKPESRFIARVNSHLPKVIYFLKLNLPYTRGVADSYYSGREGDLWVEYKWLPRWPQVVNLTAGKKPIVTRLQREWILGRHEEGRFVRVFVGGPEGVLLVHPSNIDMSFVRGIEMFSEEAAARWIELHTLGYPDLPSS